MKEIKRYDPDFYFEEQIECENGKFVYFDDIEPIIEQSKRMMEMLKKLEYRGVHLDVYGNNTPVCPICWEEKHDSNCELAKLIEDEK